VPAVGVLRGPAVGLVTPGAHTAARRAFAAGLICLGIAAAAYGILHVTFGPRPFSIQVRWAPDVDDVRRQVAERRYGLSQGEPLEGRTWRYALNDRSPTNVRALVSDAVIEDTQNIDRTAFQVSPSAPRLPDQTSHTWIPVGLRGVTVLCLILGLIGIGLGLIERAAPGTTAAWFVPRQRRVGVTSPDPIVTRHRIRYLNPRAAAYGLASLIAVAIACDVLWMPIQGDDSLSNLLIAQRSPSVWASFNDGLVSQSYLRPFRIAQIKALFDVAQGSDYWLVYRGFHALLVGVAIFLFTRVLRVSTMIDFAAAAFALVTLTGLHTFSGTVREAFPINHYLEIVVFCLLALNLARSRGGIWVDAAAVLTFAVATLTLESGLLIWVVAAAAWAVGWRGVSARGLVLMTALLVGYAYLRFVHLSSGLPELTERSSGYLLSVLDPPELRQLQQRFGAHPLIFYSYNVVASAMSVLFSEPQAGVFETVRAWLDDTMLPRAVLPVTTSVVTTGLIVWTAMHRAARRRPLDDTARFILVCVAVLGANAALSFAYTRDEIMSPAGAFYALAAFGAMRDGLLTATTATMSRAARGAFALLLCVLAVGWAVRSAGVHYILRSQAVKQQADWVGLTHQWRRSGLWPTDPAEQRLILRLRADAVRFVLPNTRVDHPAWPTRIWTD
jgi:hypothetical protein